MLYELVLLEALEFLVPALLVEHISQLVLQQQQVLLVAF
jgi:hypothetical protein